MGLLATTAVVAIIMTAGPVAADEVLNLTLNPNDYFDAAGVSSAAVGVTGDYPAGFGPGSFQASGVGYVKYGLSGSILQSELGFLPTIGEIESMSYYTKNSTGGYVESNGDWFLQIYTNKQSSGNYGSFYHDIMNAEPYLANNLNAPLNTWNQWQTGSGANQLTFGINSNQLGANGDPTLSQVTGDSAYSSQTIEVIGLATGSGWASGFNGEVNGLSMTFRDPSNGGADTVNVFFEPLNSQSVPEPSRLIGILSLCGVGLIGLVWRRRRWAA
jgi:hypothetical protein